MEKRVEKNEAQEQAVSSVDGQVLLISCPGSGKTTTMLRRISHMINIGIPEECILMVTFTDAAATEMRERFLVNYGNGGCGKNKVSFSTIHALCLKVLTAYSDTSPRIMSQDDQFSILKDALRQARIPAWISRKEILTDISAFKNSGTPASGFMPAFLKPAEFKKIYSWYEEEKKRAGFTDFDDILLNCRILLTENQNALMECRRRYRYIMVDEYQDTNNIQKEILYLLAGPNGNICVVGDDDQSIYGFRGANPRVMLDFERDYPQCKKIKMNTNYRSRPEIIKAAKNLIECNTERFEKDIRPSRDGNGKVVYQDCEDRTGEISFLIGKIKELYSNGIPRNEIAVLTRTNMQLAEIAAGMEREDIPYCSGDAIPDVYEHFVFGDLIAYLNLIEGNGNLKDLARILNRPNRYLRESDVMRMGNLQGEDLLDAAIRIFSGSGDGVTRKAAGSIAELKRTLLVFKGKPLVEQVSGIADTIGYRKFLSDYAKRMDIPAPIFLDKLSFFEGELKSGRFKDLNEWKQAARHHIAIHKRAMKAREKNGVTLSTMHRSKGLEWDVVFITDCCQGLTPLLKSGSTDCFAAIEEERRLFYVAATRAREYLYILRYTKKSDSKGNQSVVAPSMFIRELNGEVARKKSEQATLSAMQKDNIKKSASQFAEGEPGKLRVGMQVHHDSLGEGVVISKNLFFINVRFESGIKMFPLKEKR